VVDVSTRDPLQALNWDTAANIDTVLVNGVPTAYVYFGAAGETFGETNANGTPLVTSGWTAAQMAAVMNALQNEYTPITGINYVMTTNVAEAEFRMLTVPTATYGARFYPQDPAYGTQEGIGTFNLNSGGFGAYPQSLDRGGYSYAVILHEFGHAHGIAHPHDNGGGSEIMPGVAGSTGTLGVFNLNQGVYTVMSYNDGWQLHPDGPSAFTVAGIDNGWSATLGAFDIAVLQARYGIHAYNETDTTYALTDVTDDAFYQTIWDTGGTDTIAYSGSFNAQIDLTAATLDYSPTGGGVLSFLYNPRPLAANSTLVRGGFTIANGVIIENATGGSGNDVLIGNAAANLLTGNSGDDTLFGRDGNDALRGGLGNDGLDGGNGIDTAIYSDATGGVTVDLALTGAQDTVSAGLDTLTSVENLVGSGFDDVLRGDGGSNALSGGAGNDLLSGGAGDDALDGGIGTDTATYADATGRVTVDLALTGAQNTGNAGLDTLTSVENLVGSSFDDILRGNTGSNVLNGGAGHDLLWGGAGNDSLIGGVGLDTASYAGATSSVTANLLSGLATGGAGNDTLNTIENLIGSGFNDRLIGDLGVNRISGGNGVDVVTLGGGSDVFVAEIGATPIALRTGSMSVDIITDFDASGNDFIDLSGLGVAFNFRGTSANRNAGDLTYKMFDSVNGAESALGFDIDGYAGASGISGPVTVVYGNTNGGTPEFAIILLNTRSVEADDFIFHTTQAAQGSSIPLQTASHAAFDLFV
jgi:Ca2+-binding RTX toxin-like protein